MRVIDLNSGVPRFSRRRSLYFGFFERPEGDVLPPCSIFSFESRNTWRYISQPFVGSGVSTGYLRCRVKTAVAPKLLMSDHDGLHQLFRFRFYDELGEVFCRSTLPFDGLYVEHWRLPYVIFREPQQFLDVVGVGYWDYGGKYIPGVQR